jgi:hypothetical protein
MPREPKVIPVSDEEYARLKAEKADRCKRFLVTGHHLIRDAITRESMGRGEYVWLDPEETVIALLTAPGLVKEAPETAKADVKPAEKAKAGKDA